MINNKLLTLFATVILSGCAAESAPIQWQAKQISVNKLYQAHLDCDTLPETGPFQHCTVSFTDLKGNAIDPASPLIDGGMPLHGHGLPTSPVLTALEKTGTYRIDGLKYNMSGAWLLGFKIKATQGEDKIIFDFVV
uniref:YtkA-like domain-containing protein n=1 Tax=uncultured Thiotrichaceae bacterium TaxID=298394 RepID=A0A6S6UCY2_9GAMM|nr:MAG: Unknown protein [uncultured Thiotrichaceae bacterium]